MTLSRTPTNLHGQIHWSEMEQYLSRLRVAMIGSPAASYPRGISRTLHCLAWVSCVSLSTLIDTVNCGLVAYGDSYIYIDDSMLVRLFFHVDYPLYLHTTMAAAFVVNRDFLFFSRLAGFVHAQLFVVSGIIRLQTSK